MEFTKSLPADTVLEWSEMVEKWELNNEEVNLFVPTMKSKQRGCQMLGLWTDHCLASCHATWGATCIGRRRRCRSRER
jgi:hypothetical protein